MAAQNKVALEHVFAVGDGENDLGMLHRDFAACTLALPTRCPLCMFNVLSLGGFVAESEVSLGVLEALEFYFGD